ncbi:hypothetical protein HID58_002941 [Brassica napus]|uniref:Uncharacterized protein n=1 Tax=Brassica napus TaxID=3708 RepID=A0ABQ8ENP9_BRANA|nr:hypothetical protein HID58_002941 [Brassica napus]
MDLLSLNNDDEYASEDAGSEQEMDENNPIVDESLMSTAEGKAGCDLDEEGKEDKQDTNVEAEGSGRKKRTRLN